MSQLPRAQPKTPKYWVFNYIQKKQYILSFEKNQVPEDVWYFSQFLLENDYSCRLFLSQSMSRLVLVFCVVCTDVHVLEDGCGYKRACCAGRSGALLVLLFHIHCCCPRALLQFLFIDNKRHAPAISLHCSEHKHNGQPGKNTLGLNSERNMQDAG